MRARLLALALAALTGASAHAQGCGDSGMRLQVLGSGGAQLHTRRAATSYLLWLDGKARVLVDIGGGAALRFGESGAQATDLDVVLLSQLQVDRTADLATLVKAAMLENRTRVLPIYGPAGNKAMPATVTFVRDLFDPTRGAYRYLGTLLSPMVRNGFRLDPHDVRDKPAKLGAPRRPQADILAVFANERLRVSAITTSHGQAPALAWRIEALGKSVVLAGDSSSGGETLRRLARGADLLVLHNAVAEDADAAARALYPAPSQLGALAQAAEARQLVLAHRTGASLGREDDTLTHIRKHYAAPVALANDLDCFAP